MLSNQTNNDSITYLRESDVRDINTSKRLIAMGKIDYETLGVKCPTRFFYVWHTPLGLVTDLQKPGFRRD